MKVPIHWANAQGMESHELPACSDPQTYLIPSPWKTSCDVNFHQLETPKNSNTVA